MCIVKLSMFLSKAGGGGRGGGMSFKCPKFAIVLFPAELRNNEARWRNNSEILLSFRGSALINRCLLCLKQRQVAAISNPLLKIRILENPAGLKEGEMG